MPRMNGMEFLQAVKADQTINSVPIVVLTTFDVENDVVRCYELGAASYITKPVDMQQFVTAINQIGEYWFSLVRLPQVHKI